MTMKIAVYPGSFDPVTAGHIDIIDRASKIFDLVYVAVIRNPEKEPAFSIDDRVKMLKGALSGRKKIKVDSFGGLLIDYVDKVKATAIVRGLRAVSDFDYEFQMALTNRKMDPNVETIFLMTDYKYSYLSSSLVKEIARFGGRIGELVPNAVKKTLGTLKEGKE